LGGSSLAKLLRKHGLKWPLPWITTRIMSRKLKPVDDTPICDPACLRRIDPVWMPGPVPPRFWEDRKHRRNYLLWLGHRQGFRTMEDFYRLGLGGHFRRKIYGGGLKRYWQGSAVAALRDGFPQYDWKPWLFAKVPHGQFWDSRANQRSYLEWLGKCLGYRSMDDWYGLSVLDFHRNKGSAFIQRFQYSPAKAVTSVMGGRNWCEWKFKTLPNRFWNLAENRNRYLRWLGKELGFRRPEDWYSVRRKDFDRLHGYSLLARFPLHSVMREFLPQLNCDRFDRQRQIKAEEILAWADAHYARQGKWPTCDSGVIFGMVRTWKSIDSRLRKGLQRPRDRTTLAKFLAKHRDARDGRSAPTLSETEILAWADAYFAANGKWPGQGSGRIPGTRETWTAVHVAMQQGRRGFRRGSSLAQLLVHRRGARRARRLLRPLSEEQVLAWADTYFADHEKWPSEQSGLISGTGETWAKITGALRNGFRGLRQGSSLAQLLAEKRGARNQKCLPSLPEEQILAWAKAHFKATRRWPVAKSGSISQSPENSWLAVDKALRRGSRGLPGGSSLSILLRKHGLK
jgi:hypothetical protein